jgi:mono/diheme cytochrome c family protein
LTKKTLRKPYRSYRALVLCLLALGLAAFLCLADEPSTTGAASAASFTSSVQPVLAKNCTGCHNAKLKTGGLNLEGFASVPPSAQDRDTFEKVLRKLEAGEMPPKGLPRPSEAELNTVAKWIQTRFGLAARTSVTSAAPVKVRRLNRVEYNNSIRDLLGIDVQPANDFPQDDSAYGFDNIAQALSVSPLLMEKYLASAERIARAAVFGPDLKTTTEVFLPPLPRRMEFTNRTLVPFPAYYSKKDYDETGLSQPGSFHKNYRFPADGEYLIRIAAAGFRPNGSDPGEVTFWFDGKPVQTFPVEVDTEQSGFERRPDHWDVRIPISAGPHELTIAFPHQFDGLPTVFGGLNPSQTPYDKCKVTNAGSPRCLEEVLKQLNNPNNENFNPTTPERIQRVKDVIQRAKDFDATPPIFEGMSVHEVDITGPYNFKQGPTPEAVRKIFICGSPKGPAEPACERRIISNLAYRAFRGPVAPQKVDQLVAISQGARKRGGSYQEGISLALATILASPSFLFRVEAEPGNQFALASRLSYFLWSSMPDDELLRSAERGNLNQPDVLRAQVRRMLADPKAQALAENFAGQWLEIRRLESAQPDRERFPDFDEYLRASMIKETEMVFHYVMRQDRSVLDFINGPYSFLNERLARHYGIAGVTGTDFRKVDLIGTRRSGILTHASVLAVSSYGNRTSVVLRGKWILENILNAPPPPPPANVPSLDEDAVGASASLRQQMEQHRKNPTCATCHTRMDPLGFGLENYDAVGAWRQMDGKFPIDSSGVLPGGRTFQGADGLKTILAEDRDAFAECLAEKMLTYALGRGVSREDQPTVGQIVSRMRSNDYRFSSLVDGVVNSALFLNSAVANAAVASNAVASNATANKGAPAK